MSTTQQWVVIAELDRPADDLENDELVDELIQDLHDLAPALSASPDGWLQITITLPANTLRQAIANALPRLEAHGSLSELQTLPQSVRDAREGIPQIPELVSIAQAADILGVSRQATLDMVDAGKLHATKVGRALVASRAAVEALALARARSVRPTVAPAGAR